LEFQKIAFRFRVLFDNAGKGDKREGSSQQSTGEEPPGQ